MKRLQCRVKVQSGNLPASRVIFVTKQTSSHDHVSKCSTFEWLKINRWQVAMTNRFSTYRNNFFQGSQLRGENKTAGGTIH